ncbi:MAG TPA: type VI secretion system protein TssA [Bryobacteraceae bacterium]|nr:type VI secretion system protein TssA [Bryobacteraceae bacterium]
MPLREDLLKAIPGEQQNGANLRYAPIYDQIKEARREDDELAQGAWQHDRKVADFNSVIKLTEEAIATQSKDLQLAAWLTEALIKKYGFAGLHDGLQLCLGLVNDFWDTLYPEIEDGDLEPRAAPLEWIGGKLDASVKSKPLCNEGYNFFQYKDSRAVGYEDDAKSKEQKAAREKALKEGKLAPEAFDKAFVETPKAFYLQSEKQLDSSLQTLKELNKVCDEKFQDAAPSFSKLNDGITEVRHVVHALLQKKRETEPDPVEEVAPEAVAEGEAAAEGAGAGAGPAKGMLLTIAGLVAAEPEDRREAIANVVAAAALLRKREPYSPAPYLMLRGLRWGELRAASDPLMLTAPGTEYRQQIRALALAGKWTDLLETTEYLMGLPCSRAWLDLQRATVDACVALGEQYNAIAIAIRSELRTLLRDLPQLLDATLSDDTPAANTQTQAWLKELMAEPSNGTPAAEAPASPVAENTHAPGWQKKFIDPQALAQEAMRTNQPQKAIDILQKEVERQLSGRGKFQRKLQLAQICIAAGKDVIAQTLLDDIAAAIEAHKLDDWEDHALVASAMVFLLQASKKIQGDAKAKQAMLERLCRLDPVQAMQI